MNFIKCSLENGTVVLDHLENKEIKVVTLGNTPKNWVVRSLLALFNLFKLHVGMMCCLGNCLGEKISGNEV